MQRYINEFLYKKCYTMQYRYRTSCITIISHYIILCRLWKLVTHVRNVLLTSFRANEKQHKKKTLPSYFADKSLPKKYISCCLQLIFLYRLKFALCRCVYTVVCICVDMCVYFEVLIHLKNQWFTYMWECFIGLCVLKNILIWTMHPCKNVFIAS